MSLFPGWRRQASHRSGLFTSLLAAATISGLMPVLPVQAQITVQSVECLNDPACVLQQQSGSIVDMIEDQAAADAPPKAFLINRSGALNGIPALATDAQIVDYGINQVEGDPYWDAYGTGALIEAPANNALGRQIWHVNFASKIRRQITDGTCYTGIGTIPPDWRCAFQMPLAASSAGDLAFIQQVVAAPNVAPETPHWQVAILSGGVGRIVDVQSSKPRTLSWSPNAEWLLVPNGRDLTVISKSTGLVCDYPDVSTHAITYADWGDRDGGQVVYGRGGDLWLLSLKPGPKANRCPNAQVTNQQQLTSTDDHDDRPQWLQPSNLIGFTSNRATSGNAGWNLWAINPDNPAPSAFALLSFPVQQADWQGSSEPANKARIKGALRN